MRFSESLEAILQNGREEDLMPLLKMKGPGSFAVCQIFDTPAERGLGGYYGSTPTTIEYARLHSAIGIAGVIYQAKYTPSEIR